MGTVLAAEVRTWVQIPSTHVKLGALCICNASAPKLSWEVEAGELQEDHRLSTLVYRAENKRPSLNEVV